MQNIFEIEVYTPADETGMLQNVPTGGDRAGKVVGMHEKIRVLVGRRMHSLVAGTIVIFKI